MYFKRPCPSAAAAKLWVRFVVAPRPDIIVAAKRTRRTSLLTEVLEHRAAKKKKKKIWWLEETPGEAIRKISIFKKELARTEGGKGTKALQLQGNQVSLW